MKKWYVEMSQNDWEYTGWVTFFAKEVTQKNEDTLLVDGKEMQFEEEIRFKEFNHDG